MLPVRLELMLIKSREKGADENDRVISYALGAGVMDAAIALGNGIISSFLLFSS